MDSRLKKYIIDLELNKPASMHQLAKVEKELGFKLPNDYIDFMLYSNGCEGSIGESYIRMWKIEELIAINKDYEVEEYVPGLFLFGSNGGGEAFAFDTRSDNIKFVMVPFMFEFEAVIDQGNNLIDFFERFYFGHLFDN